MVTTMYNNVTNRLVENHITSQYHGFVTTSSSGASISVAKKASEAGELEARETGDEHARDRIFSPSLPPLRAHHFCSERDVWERGRICYFTKNVRDLNDNIF